MHAYSGGYSRKPRVLRATLGAIALCAGFGLLWLVLLTLHPAPIWALVGLALAIALPFLGLGLGLLFLDHLWRWLCTTPWIGVRDFAGAYEECSADGQSQDHPATLKIIQNWNEIDITFKSGDATYKSMSAAIIKDRLETGDVEFVVSYYSYGSHNGEEREGAHYGTFFLKRAQDGQLDGCYFTDSKRANYRQLMLKPKAR